MNHDVLEIKDTGVIREQLERLIASAHFNQSRRFPTFLRFVVEHALNGDTESLKERTIGIEVFGRGHDYDTASDPIVRVTAAEIRKRIAQYYAVPGHEGEMRISLHPGSYVPQFLHPHEVEAGAHADHSLLTDPSPAAKRTRIHYVLWAILIGAVLFGLGFGTGSWSSPHRPGFDSFWGPVLHSRDSVLLCVADQNQYSAIALRDAADPNRQVLLKDNLTAVVLDDLTPVVRIAGILQSNGKQYEVRGESVTSLNDLRAQTTILVGAFDNAWSLRLTKPLRFHFENDPSMSAFRITDRGPNPHAPWIVERSEQMNTNNYKDYALVARFTDPTTGKLTIIAAGVARGGTIAAGEFITNPSNLNQIERAARQAGNKPNFEIVLSTQIVNGDPGIPTMEASFFW